MKHMLPYIFFLATLLTGTHVFASEARETMETGARLYDEGQYDQALETFTDALTEAEENEALDTAPAWYNAGNALQQMSRFDEAGDHYMRALRSDDLDLQSKAYFNRGNALIGLARRRLQGGELEEAMGTVDEALAMYENAIRLGPDAEDPKVNYELAGELKQMLEQFQQQQQQQQGEEGEQDQQQDQQQDEDGQGEPSDGEGEQQADADDGEEEGDDGNEPDDGPGQDEQDGRAFEGEMTADQMTEEEARLLLDAMREEEMARRELIRLEIGDPVAVEKDW